MSVWRSVIKTGRLGADKSIVVESQRSLTPRIRDKAGSKMTRAFQMHQCIDFLGARTFTSMKMIARRRTPWMIGVIAALVLLAGVTSATSVKLRELRRRSATIIPYQEPRIEPVLIKVTHKYPDDGVSANCTDDICRNARDKFNFDVNKEPFQNKGKLKKVTLQKTHKRIKIKYPSTTLSETSRTRRDLGDDYLSRRNASDYYAERRAVMERYYARQREINARYASRTSNISGRSNATRFRLGPNKNSTARGDSTTFRQSAVKIDPIYSNKFGYRTPNQLGNQRDITPETDLDFKPDADLSQTRNSGNIERNALDYYVTPTPCTNLSLSGTFAPKTRPKHAQNCTDKTEQGNENSDTSPNNDNDHQRWGRCDGRVVYQHNLLLGLKGPSNLDALFEVIIQGPVCITCVETMRYNETRAMVSLDSGGRGYDFAKLKLKGYENEGFSYIIKIWGTKKIDQNCDKD